MTDQTRAVAPEPPKTEKELLAAMPLEEKVKYHYEHGQGSIQDIARVYRLDVDEVLHMIGLDELATVKTNQGDLIDDKDAGNAVINRDGETFSVPYDLK